MKELSVLQDKYNLLWYKVKLKNFLIFNVSTFYLFHVKMNLMGYRKF